MATKTVTKEYQAYPGSKVYKESDFVGLDANGKPVMEESSYIDCPDCGTKLKILQHAGTADGLPFTKCGRDCSPGDEVTVIDYD